MQVYDSIRTLKGVGQKAEVLYEKIGITTVDDLIHYIPRTYDEFKNIQPINTINEEGVAAICGTLSTAPNFLIKGRLKLLTVNISDGTGTINVVWYNMPFLKKQLKFGTKYILRGRIVYNRDRLEMQQPKIYTKEDFYKLINSYQPVYSLTKGLTNNAITKAVKNAFSEIEKITDYLPAEIKKRNELMDYKSALRKIHFPSNKMEMINARKRLVFDEIFLYTLALNYIKKSEKQKSDNVIKKCEFVDEFISRLSFSLTNAQAKVYDEIVEDMTSGYVMNRLVQGDVGSGKTIVAILALLLVVKNNLQGAFMVPTEVLARQHYNTMNHMLFEYGIKVGLLVGSMTNAQKKEAKEKIKNHEFDIVIGTHALIQEGVEFNRLSLVVTDEQHRFGVKQREKLSKKGDLPHVLAMSATPIPRTLALILYGDMDLSIIDEKPSNRLPIKNCVVDRSFRNNAYKFMQNQIEEGHQIYIICPMVEESENSELENVVMYSESIKTYFSENVKIDYLHGKMTAKKKDEIMESFSNGDIDILVSTTVIEVGIDVENATVVMIENSERFGLASLHQLRGRVGRSEYQSYCIFMTGNSSKDSMQRLQVLAKSNDGFYIANEDLKQRGQGDLFGVRQSGDNYFELFDVYEDANIMKMASEAAKEFTSDDMKMFFNKNIKLKNKLETYLGQIVL